MDGEKLKELCFAVELDGMPMSIRTYLLTSTFVSPIIFNPCEQSRERINNALLKNNAGITITRIDCGRPVSTWFTIHFLITNIESSKAFFRNIVDDARIAAHLQTFDGDWYRANVIRYTFHNELCRGLNRFFDDNRIDWRIKKIESPGG